MKKERISDSNKYLIVGTAVFYDTLQALFGLFHFIPVVGNGFSIVLGYMISILAFLTFFVWFSVKGVSFFRGKKAARRTLLWVSEYIPVLNSLPIPGWTFFTIYTIKMVQSEDKEENAKNSEEKEKKSNLRLVKGVRGNMNTGYKKAA